MWCEKRGPFHEHHILENVMSFNSSVLSEKTVKSFVDRLLRRYKSHPNSELHSIKRAIVQEDVAAMLGYASWHALSSQIKSHLAVAAAPMARTGLLASKRLQEMSQFDDYLYVQEKESADILEWDVLRQHFFVMGLEHVRCQWYQELLNSNPTQPVLFVQGPLSSRLPWSNLTLHNHAITAQAFFLQADAHSITDFLVRLMAETGGDNAMWKERAISLISAVVLALVHVREHEGLHIDGTVISEYLSLEKIQQLSQRRDFPQHVLQSLKAYLRSLPAYQANAPKQSETVFEQHGYLQMQFTRILKLLEDQPTNALEHTRIKISFDTHVDVTYPIVAFLKQWSVAHPKGLIVVDGLEHTSALYHLMLQVLPILHENNAALAIGSTSSADLPDDIHAQKRLASRIGSEIQVRLI